MNRSEKANPTSQIKCHTSYHLFTHDTATNMRRCQSSRKTPAYHACPISKSATPKCSAAAPYVYPYYSSLTHGLTAPSADRTQSPQQDPPHEDATMASEPTLSSLAQLAASAVAQDVPSAAASTGRGKSKEQLRRYYIRTLHKVVDEADVVVLVLDARDPAGCRSRLVEEEVRRREAEGKRLVFVLNKIGAPHFPLPFTSMMID